MLNSGQTARLIYYSASVRQVSPGDHVLCAVTGARIPLNELKYWSAEHQEAYASAAAATERHKARLTQAQGQ